MADGNVHKPKKRNSYIITINLNTKDRIILERFKEAISAENPIRYCEKRNSVTITIHSIEMMNDLIKHGCVPRKTFILEFPTTVPRHLISHFIRGYSDGDGCVGWYYERKHPTAFRCRWMIAGAEAFLLGIANILYEELGVKASIYPDDNIFALCIFRNDDFRKCLEWLYADADETLYLHRKYKKFEEWKEIREKISKRQRDKHAHLICGCDTEYFARGFCNTHYQQFMKYDKMNHS